MQVILHDNGQRHPFNFEPSAQTWKKQNGDFLIGLQTNLPGILGSVFVKKWAGTAAPGQLLMMQSIHRPLPNTPQILGHVALEISSQPNSSTKGSDHYYFLESLPKSFKLLDDLIAMKRLDPEKAKVRLNHLLIQTNAGLNVAKAAVAFLTEVNEREFVYPDFTQKNIMIDIDTSEVKFIDIDSCLPSSELRPDIPDMSSKFAIVYWGAWLQKISTNQTATTLSQTMVLSFAAIWARAVAMMRSAPDNIESVQKLLRNPGFLEQQSPLWDSLETIDQSAFQRLFLLRDATDSSPCFEQWKAISETLKRGAVVPWTTITAIIDQIFGIVQNCPVAISTPVIPEPVALPFYSHNQIVLAGFTSGLLAPLYMVWRNAKIAGAAEFARKTIGFGSIAFGLVLLAAFLIRDTYVSTGACYGILVSCYFIARKHLEPKSVILAGGDKVRSNWSVLGVVLSSLLVFITTFVLIGVAVVGLTGSY